MTAPNFQQKTPLQPLYCNHDCYWIALNEYYQQTQRQEILAKWTEAEFDSYVVKVLFEKFGDKLDDQPLRVLGVGSSEGNQETLQLKKLKTKFSQISATVIEPSTERISKYQDMVRQNSSDITRIEYSWHNQTFHQFVTSMKAGQKYHFITIIHAIYFVGEVEDSVRKLYELLEPGGIIFLIAITGHTGMGFLMKTFPHLALEKQTPSATTEPQRVKTNYFTNSTVVQSILKKYQMAYTHASSYIESVDLTTYFTEEETTPDTKLMLDFITMTVKFHESEPGEIFNQVMDFIKRYIRVKKSDQGDDKYYFDTECDILVISK
ncbi:histamine N-methyltransferase B-like [Amphiura filiformis]|uniref:histamine N-methyltransferase B-like n=1 Tax=Amphiura filiformis TaxID=82378 RepID=UPI003B20C166